jgi:O-antigen ligase
LLGETFFHYFLQYPQISGLFPYLRPSHLALDTYGTYFYSVSSIGALAFPLTWCGAAQGFTTKKQPVKKATYLLLLLLPFAVAFANLCLGGVNIRYLSDILFPLILLGLLVVLELAGKASERLSDGTSYRIFLLFAGILALTALMAFFLLFANERNGIYLQNPAIFRFFASLFS